MPTWASSTMVWADERLYYPLDFEPSGKQDPQFRTKLKIGVELVRRAVQTQILFRAVVADVFYGEDRGESRRITRSQGGLRASF
jgi:SRSO17 transposase